MKNNFEKQDWGFSVFSEKINGRLAMLALVVLIIIEVYTKQSIIEKIKLNLTLFFQ